MNDGSLVVVAAMPRELRPLVRALRLRPAAVNRLPAWSARGVLAVAVGVGPTRAAAGAERALGEVTARQVWITGVAGGVDPSCRVGDLVRPATVVDVRSGAVLVPTRSGPHAGSLATLERIYLPAADPAGAAAVRLPDGTTAVDMETAAIAAVCETKGVPWDVVRAVSDVAGTLTPEVASLLRPDGRADVPAAVRLVLRHPTALVRLVRLGRGTAMAVRVAARTVIVELAAEGVQRDSRRTR